MRRSTPRRLGLTLLVFKFLSPTLPFTEERFAKTLGSRADAGGTVGKRVEALWEDDLNFYPATVVKDFENGTVQIRWDDPDGHPDISNSDLEDVRPLRLSYSPGDLVVALYEEDYEWYNATVVQDRGDGKFVVLWDDPDGGPELSICPPENIRMVEVVDDYKPGDPVEALYDEDQTWYTGVVQDSCGEGFYVVLWDDPGDAPETTVCRSRYMKHLSTFSDYQVGDHVHARIETGEFLPAVVGDVHPDGTFEVQWEGEKTHTSRCNCEDMKGVFRDYTLGDRVEALYPDSLDWQVGVVRRQLDYGAFLVRWDYPTNGHLMSMCTPEEMSLLEEEDDIEWLEDSDAFPCPELPSITGAEDLFPASNPMEVHCPEPPEAQSTQIHLSKVVAYTKAEVSARPCLTLSPRQRGHRWNWRQHRVSRLLGSTVKRSWGPGGREKRVSWAHPPASYQWQQCALQCEAHRRSEGTHLCRWTLPRRPISAEDHLGTKP
ncbi:unnamed protein product [Durusdinium trenchii]|uniref:Tudor domain-containing protein n=1 Tax=Durusdinium trenchii TaxID=1381693 RepID=A0ABP0Q1F7_9DINO